MTHPLSPTFPTFRKVFRRINGRYERGAELFVENDDVLTTPLLPGLEPRVPKIFDD